MSLERTPPSLIEAEQALLGSILANRENFDKVSDFLKPIHFADALHSRIFELISKELDRREVVDALTLRPQLEDEPAFKENNTTAGDYLAYLQSLAITVINPLDYAKMIFDLYLRRSLIALGEDVVNDAFRQEEDRDAQNQIDSAEQRLYELAEHGQANEGPIAFNVALTEAINRAVEAQKNPDGLSGESTGLEKLDFRLGGLQPSDLLILAGRPGMGKTSLAVNIAHNVAKKGTGVAFFSLEMSSEQLATRVLSETSGISGWRIRRGQVDPQQFHSLVDASRSIESLPLYIDDTPALSIGQLKARARRLKRNVERGQKSRQLGLICVDYLQLMRGSGRSGENRVQEISEISRGLKGIAKDLDVPVIALSQLSRAVEQRDDKRPQLSDLRESGSIEQDADIVMFVYRAEYYLGNEPEQGDNESQDDYHKRHDRWKEKMDKYAGKADVIIAKHRHGSPGTATMAFHGETTSFRDLIEEDELEEYES